MVNSSPLRITRFQALFIWNAVTTGDSRIVETAKLAGNLDSKPGMLCRLRVAIRRLKPNTSGLCPANRPGDRNSFTALWLGAGTAYELVGLRFPSSVSFTISYMPICSSSNDGSLGGRGSLSPPSPCLLRFDDSTDFCLSTHSSLLSLPTGISFTFVLLLLTFSSTASQACTAATLLDVSVLPYLK